MKRLILKILGAVEMKLKDIREKIDQIDKELVKLLNQRAGLALQMKELKNRKKMGIYSPERERQIYDKIAKLNRGPLSKKMILSIFREVISSCLSIQKPLQIAYLGPPLSFTHQAAMSKFGKEAEYMSCSDISFTFNEVEKSRATYGVVPIENSTEGIVNYTLDMFINSDLKICSEVLLEVSHYLLSKANDIKEIKKVYSNPQVFPQCRKWIEERLPDVEFCDVKSTSEAAKIVSGQKNAAAIASKSAAQEYNLNILAEKIQDYRRNLTRFLIISKDFAKPSGKDKTSIMFSIKDRIGALHDMLVPFKENDINLTKIESRPSKEKLWEYYFFVDFQGHCEEEKVRKTLSQLSKNCTYLKILGSYPHETR